MSEEEGEPRGGYCCNLPKVPERKLKPNVDERRARLINTLGNKWANGTVLTYAFFESSPTKIARKEDKKEDEEDGGGEEKEEEKEEQNKKEESDYGGPEEQKEAMRQAFDIWRSVGIGIEFKEVPSISEADIRIGFKQGDGSWSYLGRDILNKEIVSKTERTMNIGWDITNDVDTGVHEIGHTLGFPHEHQNPNAGIVWDEERVYEKLGGPPNNWDKDRTYWNVIRKISPDEVQGSSWDPNSIMHYSFDAGLISQPEKYRTQSLRPAGGLSDRDKEWVSKFYPPLPPTHEELILNKPFDLTIKEGEYITLSIKPDLTGRYEIKTVGFSDTTLVLFEKLDDGTKKIAADDDSGEEQNAKLDVQMQKGKNYLLQVRLIWVKNSGSMLAVLMKQLPKGSPDPDGEGDNSNMCCAIL